MALLSDLRTRYNTLSKTQKDIADYILADPERATLQSITELAKNCTTSETTVMRLLKKLDIDSYQVFRISLAKELTDNPKKAISEELQEDDTLNSIKEKIITHNVTSIKDLKYSLHEEDLEKAIGLITSAERIYTYGVGASLAVATDAFHKLANIGFNVSSYPDPHLMNILLSHATPNDLFIAVSHTGESNEVLHAAQIAKAQGAKILVITSFDNSSLARLADVKLLSSTNNKKYHSEAMAARVLQLTIVDILYVGLFMREEETRFEKLNDSRVAVSKNKT